MVCEFTIIGLFVLGMVTVIAVGFYRRARWIHVRILDTEGRPLAHEPLRGRFATGRMKAQYVGSVGGHAHYQYENANDPDKVKPIGKTDADGVFRHRFIVSGLHAIELQREVRIAKQSFNYYITVQHVSLEGEMPRKPFVVRLTDAGPALLPDSML